jgi:hypothetical protein
MQRTKIIFLSLALILTNGCSTIPRKSVWHDFANGVSAYGSHISTPSTSGLLFIHIRFGDLYSRYPIQPVSGITIKIEGIEYDLEELDKKKLVGLFLKSGRCKREDKVTDVDWKSCMSTFAWGRVINHEIDFFEMQYSGNTDDEQPIITNRYKNVSYELPLSEQELFNLFGEPINTKKYFMP